MKKLVDTKLSVLDLAPVAQGMSIADSFKHTLDLAQHAEKWGYERFWMAEHHNLDGIASAATAVLLGYVAGGTKTIRVGSGGIMLPNHAPLVIAEQFGTLETLYPGRIDLGLGRAPGTDGLTMRALRREMTGREAEFSDLVQELQYYFAEVQPGQKVRAIPGAGLKVPLWLLGSSLYSAQLAAVLGLPYAFAGHFAPELMMRAIDLYRVGFQPSDVLKEPKVMVGVQVVAADTDEKAERLATSLYMRFLGIIRNERVNLQPPVENMDAVWNPMEKEIVLSKLRTSVIGGPEKVKAGLQKLIDETQADELMIVSDAFDHNDRLRSFELISQVRGAK
ncbi:LLM class flavin-dependent oxidoreductase [Bdellovibrio sp. NC01]|uniref:LLM class flavin-dependent oxidoreductase n=1 Tax=Bdellovibrio sp. NC01 TaxID=2220073 RepID=UPI001158B762|nr:LLM class flavin-dependent oxidoreductase [Bdellovibrio sp. NC01]QDK36703.1 LLM class flavin-dependent oxidoreductase [Bdellovibrio sp. NC01]